MVERSRVVHLAALCLDTTYRDVFRVEDPRRPRILLGWTRMDLNAEIERLIVQAESERDKLDSQIRSLRAALGQARIAGDNHAVAPANVGRVVITSWRGQRNATRGAIIDIMSDGRSRKVGEIARLIHKTSNATSAAVRALRDSGQLVDNGRKGYYKIASPRDARDPEIAVSKAVPTQEEALTGSLGQRSGEADIVGVAGSPGVP